MEVKLAIVGAQLIDGVSSTPIPSSVVLVTTDGRIVAVGPPPQVPIPDGAPTIRAAGVTTLRDCGADDFSVLALRDMINAGQFVGPRILASGRPITTTGGHIYSDWGVDSSDEIKKAVRFLASKGVDFIKLILSGGTTTPGTNITRYMRARGVTVFLGTDAAFGPWPGSDLWPGFQEMARAIEIMVRWAEFTPMDALALATREAGRALGLDREIGTVEKGKRADLILLAGDPLKDIRALRQVEAVFRDGQLVAHRGGIVLPGAHAVGGHRSAQ